MYVATWYCIGIQVYIHAIGNSELHNATVCEGGSETFECIFSSSISSDNVLWYRIIKNTSTEERLHPLGSNINYTTSNVNSTHKRTSLTITNAAKSYTGYYWVEFPSDFVNNCSNISLTVTTSMCVCNLLCMH